MIVGSKYFEQVKNNWVRIFNDSAEYLDRLFDRDIILCAILEKDEPVSTLTVVPHFYKNRKIGYIYGAMTIERCRGKGLMRKLLAETEEDLKKLGYSAMFLLPANEALYSYYSSCGFKKDILTDIARLSALPCGADGVLPAITDENCIYRSEEWQKFAYDEFLSSGGHICRGEDFTVAYKMENDSFVTKYVEGMDIERNVYAMSLCFDGFEWDKGVRAGLIME